MDVEPLTGIFATIITVIYALYQAFRRVHGNYKKQREAIEALEEKTKQTDLAAQQTQEKLNELQEAEKRNTETITRLQESLEAKDKIIEQLEASNRLQVEEINKLKSKVHDLEVSTAMYKRDKENLEAELNKTVEMLKAQKQRNLGMQDALEILGIPALIEKKEKLINVEK
jgi:chromosome segregation ATPase